MPSSIHFDLLIPRRIVFGWGKRREIGALAASLGTRAFLVDGSRTLQGTALWNEIFESLQTAGLTVHHIATATQEPTIEDVDLAAEKIRSFAPGAGDLVIGIGGGAALDLAKAVAGMATNSAGGSVRAYLEGIGSGFTLTEDPLPILAMPTTSGTGSEATKNAVISCNDPPCKKSLRSDKLMPSIALVDPELTVSLSPEQTAWSGMDAITQLLEAYFTKKAQPATDAWCDMGLKMGLGSILNAYTSPRDERAREEMAAAALLSGMALANSGLGMAHGVAAALGSICNVPHGLACAVMLPIALKVNRNVIAEKAEDLKFFWKLTRDSKKIDAQMTAVDVLEMQIGAILKMLKIPTRLRDLGVKQEQIPELVEGSRGNSMNGNPRTLSHEELTAILEENW